MAGISAVVTVSKANISQASSASPNPKKNSDKTSLRAGRFLLAPNMSNSLEKYKKQFSIIKDISE